MSLLNAIAQRPTLHPVVQGADQQTAAASAARQSLASATAARTALGGSVADSSDSGKVSLSNRALDALTSRVEQLGDQTIAAAQSFLQQFATSLFGDAAKGARFDFDSASVSADTTLSTASVQASASGDGGDGRAASLQAAALRFDESASFIGHGTLQTRDGQSYEFDVAVDYRASVSVSTASAATTNAQTAPGAATDTPTPEQALVGKQLPPVKYPGSLADLFKLLGRQLDVSGKDGDPDGQLSLRLIRLVNSAALLAPRAHADAADGSTAALSTAQRSRALAQYAPAEAAAESAPAIAPATAPISARALAAVDEATGAPAFSASA